MYKKEEARILVLNAWDKWPDKPEKPTGTDGLRFFECLQNDQAHLLQFKGQSGKWQVVHGWLLRNGLVSD